MSAKEIEALETVLQRRVRLQGEIFGARGCSSCSCDPCDCNPCTCGESAIPSYPAWRISGFMIVSGVLRGIDVSQHLLVSLAQPMHEGAIDQWQEVLLVDQRATRAQIEAILAVCEEHIESLPAEVETYVRVQRAVYQVPMEYTHSQKGPVLSVAFVRDQAVLVREGANPAQNTFNEWIYDGPMALRRSFG